MDKRPRIAFCFSGQARTLDQTYLFFQKNLFDAAKEQGFDYDVFCAVEDDEDVDKVKLLNPTKVEKIKSSEVRKIIEEKYGEFIKNEYKDKYGFAGNEGSVNVLQQFYKISRSILIKQDYENENKNSITYDIVFRLRFDVPFARKLSFEEINKTIKINEKNVICNKNKILPTLKYITIIEDLFFITSGKNSKIIGDVFDNRKECFIGHEIKNKILNKIFERVFGWFPGPFGAPIRILIMHVYSLFFFRFCAETYWLNYFKYHHCKLDKNNYISVWLVRDENRLKKVDFSTYSRKWTFKKGKYEL